MSGVIDDTSTAEDRRRVLLVSNRRLTEDAGRAAKFQTRKRRLADRGWELEVAYVDPTAPGLLGGTLRTCRKALAADVVNSVSNPPHLQIAGGIAAQLTGTPWVAEFRDPLVTNPDVTEDSYSAKFRRLLETFIMRRADKVVWYDGIQIPDGYFADSYLSVPESRYRKLPPIGFDEQKFADIPPAETDPVTVTYAGSFYDGWIEPYTFLEGLGAYTDKNGPEIHARFYGDWSDAYDDAAREHGVGDQVSPEPFVPHEEIVGVLKGSDVLLYVGGDDDRNRRNLPTKLYDYIGARRPILAIVDPSFRVADVIESNDLGLVVPPGEPDEVRRALEVLTSDDYVHDPDESTVERFTRGRSVDAYVETLEAAIDGA